MQPLDPFDLKAWVASRPYLAPLPSKTPAIKHDAPPDPNRTRDAYSQAKAYIAKSKPAIAGQGGSNHTYGICCALLKGFCLKHDEAKSLLDIWNSNCIPCWSHEDLERKMRDAEASPNVAPLGWLLEKPKPSKFENFTPESIDDSDDPDPVPEPEEEQLHDHSGILDDPASLVIRFLKDNLTDIGLCSYRWWNGQFYKWNGVNYDTVSRDRINSCIFHYVEEKYLEQYKKDCDEVPDADGMVKTKKKKITNNMIANIVTGLVNIISISEDNKSEPFWLDKSQTWKPEDIISSNNKLIHLPSFVKNINPSQINKNPKYFSTYSLKYNFPYKEYSGPVAPPELWGKTLEDIWPGDEESIRCLQEFYGYFLTPCTRLQKILMLIGQKRSGKGTIIRILKHMLGEENVCYPTFKSLTTQFGKQSLIGKSLAVFPDARITGRTDTGDVVETLLSISGEDNQTVERKYLTSVSTHLTTRFVIASNELPRLTENSGALVSRAIVLKFDETFLDKEDIELEQKLIPEIPGILRWAIDGWVRLYERKKFFQPKAGQQMVEDFLNISSPISHFISDQISIGADQSTDTRALYLAWKGWCTWQGRENIGDMDGFVRNLRAAIPALEFGTEAISHNGDGVRWSRSVRGIGLKEGIKNNEESPLVLIPETNGHDGHKENRINGLIPF